MKKTYIAPEALMVSLTMNAPVLNVGSTHDEEGSGQFVKEQQIGTDGSTTSGKSIWDDEW